jgi:hypothetical protein
MNLRRLIGRPGRCLLPCLLALLAGTAQADAPFLRLETATVEHDDERNFELAMLASRSKAEQSRQFVVEYNIHPLLGVELELGSSRSRLEPEREREVELGLRYVLVDHNRDDWGLALKFSAEWEREYEEEGRSPWKFSGPTVLAAFVLPLADNRVRLHANVGMTHRRLEEENRRQRLWGLGVEAHLTPTLVAFAEHAVRRRQDRMDHAGLRWWVQREKVAVQWSASRTRDAASGERVSGVHVGITFSDLSF